MGATIIPFYNLGKGREALHIKGDEYKKAVKLWLESKGMIQHLDSSIEGIFEDLVLFENSTTRVAVECKNSVIRLFSKEFLLPFGWFLSIYARLPIEDRFRFLYFARISYEKYLLNNTPPKHGAEQPCN